MGKTFNFIFFKSSIIAQMALYFSDSFSSFMHKDINLLFLSLSPSLSLNVLTYPHILGNIKTNGLITSSKYSIKDLELFFVSVKFEIIISSKSQIFIVFLHQKILILLLLSHQILTLLYYKKKNCRYVLGN